MKKSLLLFCSVAFTITSMAKTATIPVLNLSATVGQEVTMQMENYRDGGEGVAYHDMEPANQGGAYRPTEGVDLADLGGGNYCVGWTVVGEWLEYSINVPETGFYSFEYYVSSPESDIKFYVDYAGGSSNLITVPKTGAWSTWGVGGMILNLQAGVQVIRYNVALGGNLDKAIIKRIAQLSNVATLNGISVAGVPVAGVSPSVLSYEVTAPYKNPPITAITTDYTATYQTSITNNVASIVVTAADGTTKKTYTVNLLPFTLPSTIGQTVTLQMENFDADGEGVGYHDTESANQGLGYRLNEGVDISQISATEYCISYAMASEWLKYTVNVPVSGRYTFQFYVAYPNNDIKFNLEYAGGTSQTVTVPNTGGFTNWQTGSIQLNLLAGVQTIKLNIISGGNFDKASITLESTTGITKSFDSDKPTKSFNTEYYQSFITNWDSTSFYNQWDIADPLAKYDASDMAQGYLQLEWIYKRVLISKVPFYPPYIIQTQIEYPTTSNQGGVVLRANPTEPDQVQVAQGGPGFNSEGIAFYPTSDGLNMIVQFSGVYRGDLTKITRILVAKPASVTSLKDKGLLRIEDFGTSIYVYYNDAQLTRIDLGGKVENTYTSGTVYNYKMEMAGTFTDMEVEAIGKLSIAQRVCNLKLYSVKIDYDAHIKQTINFPTISKKLLTDAPFTISATATSGLPVLLSIVSGPATLVGDVVTLSGELGVVTLKASQYGNELYYPANDVITGFYVTDPAVNNAAPFSQDYVDNWVVTDALGRQLPTYDEVGAKRINKQVGVFYYLWLGAHSDKVYDTSKIIAGYPADPMSPNNPGWPTENATYFWGEPEVGYNRSEDPWVIRRDLQMLSNAHVDFLFFDTSNGYLYLDVVKTLCEVSLQMRKEGIHTPQIAFLTNAGVQTVNYLYDHFYAYKAYDELWFKWEGKPLLLGNFNNPELRPEVKDFFTMRWSWAWTDQTKPQQWQWLDTYPQDYGWNTDPAIPEQIPVGVGSHPGINIGTSFNNNAQPPVNEKYLTEFTGQGLNFAEQWKKALEVDPPIVMVTQWNEWTAGRSIWDKGDAIVAGRPIKNGDSWFIDAFNQEFNRDIVPMKGGHTDNYYYQLISNVRKYKGMAEPQVFSTPTTINLAGDFTQWQNVTPIFKDPVGDVMHRNFRGYDPTVQYVNNTGRNDILESRVTYDTNTIFFYVKTATAITAYTDPNWMLLFIDADRNKGTGWEGYDYVVNLGVESATETTLKQWDGKAWGNEIALTYKLVGNEMVVSIPRTALFMDKVTPEFYFKWADNPQQLNDITSFFTDGDVAPDRRFNYNFSSSKVVAVPQSAYKTMNIPGTVECEDFDNGGAGLAYADATFGNSGGTYRTTESVDIEATAGGGYNIGWINANEWLSYTVDVKAVGSFTAKIRYSANNGGNEAILKVDGTDKSGVITFPTSVGSWAYQSFDIQLSPGKHVLNLFIKNASADFKLDKMEFIEKNVVYPGNGTGLNKSIWTGVVGGRAWFKDSICSETDAVVNENWADVSPGCAVGKDFWNIRWQGQIEPLFSETYTFYLTVNDMGRVWINNQLVVDGWYATSTGTMITGTIALTAGQKVPIKVDFAEKLGSANIKLEWSSASNPREVIPQSQLYPVTDPNAISNLVTADFKIYPNPATDKLTIQSQQYKVDNIKIIDLQGRVVYLNNERFTGSKTIGIDLEKGIYFLKLTGDVSFNAQKLIVQ